MFFETLEDYCERHGMTTGDYYQCMDEQYYIDRPWLTPPWER